MRDGWVEGGRVVGGEGEWEGREVRKEGREVRREGAREGGR